MTVVYSIPASCRTQKLQLYILQRSWLEETDLWLIQLNTTLKVWIWLYIPPTLCTGKAEWVVLQ